MTPLKTLAGLQEKATKGEWKLTEALSPRHAPIIYSAEAERVICALHYHRGEDDYGAFDNLENNAAFLEAARNFDFTALCDEMERMRKALAFYADEDSYKTSIKLSKPFELNGKMRTDSYFSGKPVLLDEGQRARQALGGKDE